MATSNVELPESMTYRQFDFWVQRGYVVAGNPGSGYARQIEPFEQKVLNLMARLTEAGLPAVLAAKVAREAALDPDRDAFVRLGVGIYLNIIGVNL